MRETITSKKIKGISEKQLTSIASLQAKYGIETDICRSSLFREPAPTVLIEFQPRAGSCRYLRFAVLPSGKIARRSKLDMANTEAIAPEQLSDTGRAHIAATEKVIE